MRLAALAACLCWAGAFAQPVVSAKSAIVVEAQSGLVLFSKNASASRFPASTTKIMTALLLLENTVPGSIIVAPPNTQNVTGTSMHLLPDERLSREDALYALLLRSANDVAHAVAVNLAGSDAAFAKMMNARALQIGCSKTAFNNPHGLNDPKHSTSAADLMLIAREAMRNTEFRTAVRTQSFVVTRSLNTKDTLIKNSNRLLKADALVEGIKTGYTIPAGKCFVGCRNLDGFQVITVVLASKDWVKDTKALYSWAHGRFCKDAVLQKGSVVGKAPVLGGEVESVDACLSDELVVVSQKHNPVWPLRYEFFEVHAPVQPGQVVGEAILELPGGIKRKVSLVAGGGVSRRATVASLSATPFMLVLALVGGGVAAVRLRKNGRTAT